MSYQMVIEPNSNILYILLYADSANVIYTFDINTTTVLNSYTNLQAFRMTSINFAYGMMIIGGGSNNNCAILKKVNIYSVDQTTDNDIYNPISKAVGGNKLTKSLSSKFNITNSNMILTGIQSSPSGTDASSIYDVSTASESAWSIQPNSFISTLSYNQNLTMSVFVQDSKTVSLSFAEPCFISTSGSISLSFPLIYSWAFYDKIQGVVKFTGPNVFGADFMNYTIALSGTSSNGERLAVYYYVKVFSCKVVNCDTCNVNSRSTCQKCKNGYILSNDFKECAISQTVKKFATASKYFAGSSIGKIKFNLAT